MPPADPRRPVQRAVGTALLAILLAGCGAGNDVDRRTGSQAAARAPETSPAGAVTPGPEPSQPAAAAAPGVPVRSAGLADLVPTSVVQPLQVAVPALGITVPVDPVGVRDDGQMEIPPLAERAGWYRFGASPAQTDGTAVIAAHVDSVASAGLGPFARLTEADVGDVIDVTLADGSARRYAVTAVERRAKPEIAWPEIFVQDGRPRLVLVTCGGTFHRDEGRYSDNVIVTAEPVGG